MAARELHSITPVTSHVDSLGRPHEESCDYNKFPIADVLKDVFADQLRLIDIDKSVGRRRMLSVLELGSGTGQHAVHFADAFRDVVSLWQTSDLEAAHAGIKVWLSSEPAAALPALRDSRPTVALNFGCRRDWERLRGDGDVFDVVFTANTFHIASWEDVLMCLECCPSVIRADGGAFCVYGPFNYNGAFTTESNAKFDAWLKEVRGPHCGIRDAGAVVAAAERSGLRLVRDAEMPENNRMLVFQKTVQ